LRSLDYVRSPLGGIRGVKYIEKPEEQWLGTAIRQNKGAEQNPTGSPDVEGEKPFTHEQRMPTT
jgi:Mn-containing catalase